MQGTTTCVSILRRAETMTYTEAETIMEFFSDYISEFFNDEEEINGGDLVDKLGWLLEEAQKILDPS